MPQSIDDHVRRDDRAAVQKAFSVLEAVGQSSGPAGVSVIARRAELPKSTAFRLLAILERTEAVVRVGNGYAIGPTMSRLADSHRSTAIEEHVRDFATPYLVDLNVGTRETVHLAVLVGTDVLYLNKLQGSHRILAPSRIGGRMPAYATAVGKAMLASNRKAASLALAGHRTAFTDATLLAERDLERELERVREDGIAFDRGESHPDLRCVAAPILGASGQAVAALSISVSRAFNPTIHTRALRRAAHAASKSLTTMHRRMIGGVTDGAERLPA
ncbi:IclR family transcriptional regulator [Microbacterium sp.]|uniref:IclR family transcriptional regulator n=1 Tax=Microbacterium sp. TaxID=51671 RepID=UPI003A8B7489